MVKRDEDMMDPARTPAATPKPGAPDESKGGATDPKTAAALSFRDAVIKNEDRVRQFGRAMEAKYPSITEYGKDWVSHDDLRALTKAWHEDKDSLKFAYGVARSENFAKLVKKYAADPGIHAFLVEGVKTAPMELIGAASGVCANDRVIKDLAQTVAKAAGLPPSITSLFGGAQPGMQAPDANKVVSEILADPRTRQAPPVSTGGR
jgi:hypothetical protein